MKKVLLILLLFCCFIFAGCSDMATVGLIQNSDGSIIELYYLPYAEVELVNAGLTWDESESIKLNAKTILDETFTNYITAYKSRINASEDYTDEQKEVLLKSVLFDTSFNYVQSTHIEMSPTGIKTYAVIEYIQYELFFANKTAYFEFKEVNDLLKEPKEVVTESSLFTTTSKVIKDPVFDNIAFESLTLGQTMIQRVQETIIQTLAGNNATPTDLENAQNRWNAIKLQVGFDSASEKLNYTYVVPTARLHSNADKIVAQNGYYYHVWEISSNNANLPDGERIRFEYWTISANRVTWYVTALIIATIIIVTTYIKANKQEKEELENFKKEVGIDDINNLE